MQMICNWDDLPEYSEEFDYMLWEAREEERDLERMKVRGITLTGMDFSQLGYHQVLFENCRFLNCNFERGTFRQAAFRNCDLSNSHFSWSYFKDCQWSDVKAMGILAQNLSVTGLHMRNCNLRYANLGESKLEKWTVENCDFTDGFLTACRLKDVILREDHFVRTSFFGTALKGLDFTGCELEGALVSEDGRELQGATVDVYQAAEFAKLLGLRVKY